MILLYKKYKSFLLFLVLQIIAFSFTYQHHSYARSKFVNSSYAIVGYFYNLSAQFSEYFDLKHQNQLLVEQNIRLKNKLDAYRELVNVEVPQDSSSVNHYTHSYARVINNSYAKIDNYLTINKGEKHGVAIDQGVVNSLGVVGVVVNTSENYATVLSVLNSKSSVSVSLVGKNQVGIIDWNGKNNNVVQLKDLPRQVQLKVGDTVVTSGNSAIFPAGIPVGTIRDFKYERHQYLKINVALFNDMTSMGYVEVIKNNFQKEQRALEQTLGDE